MRMNCPKGVEVVSDVHPDHAHILSYQALEFLADLHRRFNYTRKQLLKKRMQIQSEINAGKKITYPVSNHSKDWKVSAVPHDLQMRHVEITGPTDCKMVINAMNSGADMYMADFEDSLSPTWKNIVEGQVNLLEANKKTIQFVNPDGSVRELKDKTACLLVRTRGWHLDERHIICDNEPMAGALVDFGLYFFHNLHVRLAANSAPYFYLPKMETHLETRLWNDVFRAAQDYMGVPQGTIRATVMIETLLAAVNMEEMLYEIRDHCCGLNAGRWDYIFSAIKRLQRKQDAIFPDRKQVTMTVPFMRAYTERLVHVCHQHGAHAMGGMSAFIPSRRNQKVNKVAMEKIRQDKEREVADGFDGTWVAHPDLVPVAKEIFMKGMNGACNQKHRLREDVNVQVEELVTIQVPGGKITEEGVRVNISVALQYLNSWMMGIGAVAINNLMEDAATSEISRAQLWQWRRHGCHLDDGRQFTTELFNTLHEEELAKLGGPSKGKLGQASHLLKQMVVSDVMEEFLTIPAYEVLCNPSPKL
ncbi:malate synthase [Nematostella vectensis]|uniref:malate synthase n=1 Tax=Nematostella vectensis TaxID=45351 RepID=UPI00207798E0|nr:malate synthase [Nematostella vectensis]